MDIEKSKNLELKYRYQLELRNRFEVLQDYEDDKEATWARFKTVVTGVAKEVVGVKRGATAGKQWIRDETWEVSDRRKEQKERMLGMEEVTKKEREKYKSLSKEIKKKYRKNKAAWREGQALDAEQAARRNDNRTVYKKLAKKIVRSEELV